jgi:Tfp pilus assembly protein PilX
MFGRRASRGAALPVCAIVLTVILALAGLWCAHVSVLSRQAAHSVQTLQHELLLHSAEEEARALLACDLDARSTLHDARLTRTVRAQNGATLGSYTIVPQDTHAHARTNGTEGALAALLGDDGQMPWYWRRGRVAGPESVNAMTPAAADRLAGTRSAGAPDAAGAAAIAALIDASDADHQLSSVAGAVGDEGLSLRAAPVTPLLRAVAFAARTTNDCLHVGRLARGWSGWNSDVHFYPVAPRTSATRTKAVITLTKQYGRRSRELQHQNALNTLAPGIMNQFGVSNMWRGAVIKAVLAENTCRADAEEWLLVEQNYAAGNDMTFECVPLFGTMFSTQFVANAAGDLCQYGWHGWSVSRDPLVPAAVKRDTTEGLLCAPATTIVPQEQHGSAKPYYLCDAVVVRGLRRDCRYLVELIGDVRGCDNGTLEVLMGTAYRPVILRNGRALLFDGRAQRPLPAASANDGVLVIALRVPARAVPRGVYGAELRAIPDAAGSTDDRPTALCTWDNRSLTPIDVRAWSLSACDAAQRTQWLGRIVQRADGAAAFAAPGRAIALQQPFPLDALRAGSPDAAAFALDAGRAIRTITPGTIDLVAQMQQMTVQVDGPAFVPGELCPRMVRLLPPDAHSTDAPHRLERCSPAFAVVTNDAHSVTLRMPVMARDLAAWLAVCTTLEPIIALDGATAQLSLLDAEQRCAARALCNTAAHTPTAMAAARVPNTPFRSLTDLHNFVTRTGAVAPWRLYDAVYCDYLPLAGAQLAPDGILQTFFSNVRVTPRGLFDPAWHWQPNEFDNLYVRFPRTGVSNHLFRISKTCAHCLDLDPHSFPQHRLLPSVAPASTTLVGVAELVSAAGAPVLVARTAGAGLVRITVPAGVSGHVSLGVRSDARAACRAVISVFDPAQTRWRGVTNDCAAMRWLTPAVPLAAGTTTLLARVDVLDAPQPQVRFFDLALVPAPRRTAALNLNTAGAEQMIASLGWPRARADAMIAARPLTSLATLHAATGIADNDLLTAVPHLVLRSDQWVADLRAESAGAHAARRVLLQRHTTPAGRFHPVVVRARVPHRSTDHD